MGSLYDLLTSVSVEVTFFENVFSFRKLRQESFSALLWDPSPALTAGDPRLGLFDAKLDDASNVNSLLEGVRFVTLSLSSTQQCHMCFLLINNTHVLLTRNGNGFLPLL